MNPAESRPSKARTATFWTLLVLAVLSVVALAALRAAPEPGTTARALRQTPTSAGTATPTGAERAELPAGLQLSVGDVLAYAIESHDAVEIRAPQQDPTLREMEILGSMTVSVYAATENGWIVGFRAPDIRITTGPRPVADGAGAMISLGEVLVEVQRSGRLGKLVSFDDESACAGRLWKAILARWQVVFPDAPGAVSWATREWDPTGEYVAEYRRTPGATSDDLSKKKIRYVAADPEVEADAHITVDTCIVKLEGSERTRARLEIGGEAMSESRFRFARLGRAHRELVDEGRCRCFAESAGTTLGEAEPDESATRETVSGDAVRDHLRMLRQVLDDGKPGTLEEHGALMAVLRDLRASEAALEAVRERLRDARCDDVEASLLVAALAATGTQGAQDTLRGILADPASAPARLRMALYAVAQVTEPEASLDAELRRLRETGGEIGDSAMLVLASVGGRVRATESARYERIRADVEALLGRAQSEQELSLALFSIGNLGAAEIPSGARSALSHESAQVRAAAAEALRRIDSAKADDALRDLVRGDPSPHVRQQALDVLLRRAQLPARERLELLGEVARSDPDEDVRTFAAEHLNRA